MGVKSFFRIKVTNPESAYYEKTIAAIGEMIALSKFKGKRLCIDASLAIYSSITALESISALTDKDGKTTVHINTIFNKIILQMQAGIQQIWIFDSPEPNEMKLREYAKRKERREKAKESTTLTENMKGKAQYRLNTEHVEEIQQLLTDMGIMYIVAPPGIEAEQYGAYLTAGSPEDRFCQYMITGDSDVLFFGGNLLRISSAKTATGKSKKTIYQTFDLDDVLNELNLTYDQFLKVGVAMGTDFNDKADNYGPARVIEAIRKNKVFITPAMEKTMRYYKSDISNLVEKAKTVAGEYSRENVLKFLESRKFNLDRANTRLDDFEKFKSRMEKKK